MVPAVHPPGPGARTMSTMKIVRRDEKQMVLEGVPQGRGLGFAWLVCATLGLGFGLFTWLMWSRSHRIGPAIMPGIGTAFVLFLGAAVAGFSMRRERLILDREARGGVHTTWSVLFGQPRQTSFAFERVHAVAIQKTLESPGGGKGFPIRVTKARLLLVKPRRVIDLDEVQNAKADELEALARDVREFLGVAAEEIGSHDED